MQLGRITHELFKVNVKETSETSNSNSIHHVT